MKIGLSVAAHHCWMNKRNPSHINKYRNKPKRCKHADIFFISFLFLGQMPKIVPFYTPYKENIQIFRFGAELASREPHRNNMFYRERPKDEVDGEKQHGKNKKKLCEALATSPLIYTQQVCIMYTILYTNKGIRICAEAII